jgi:hypothetical protein
MLPAAGAQRRSLEVGAIRELLRVTDLVRARKLDFAIR